MIRVDSALSLALKVGGLTVLMLVAAVLVLALLHPEPLPATRAERAVQQLREEVHTISERVTVQGGRISTWSTRTSLVVDAVSGAQGDLDALRERTDSTRCGLLYLADKTGKRRRLSGGQWGLKGAPAGTRWAGWPDDWDRCTVCAEGYECARQVRGGSNE